MSETEPRAGNVRQAPVDPAEPNDSIEPDPSAAEVAALAASAEHARTMRLIRGVIVGVLVLLAILYFSGSLDRTLAPVGLNFEDCFTNGFGATFCGDELEQYRDSLDAIGY